MQKLEVIKRFKSMESASILLIQGTKNQLKIALQPFKVFGQKGQVLPLMHVEPLEDSYAGGTQISLNSSLQKKIETGFS